MAPALPSPPSTSAADEILARYRDAAGQREQDADLAAVRAEVRRMEAESRAEDERQWLRREEFNRQARESARPSRLSVGGALWLWVSESGRAMCQRVP